MPEMRLQSYGSMAVDWEERVRLDRLREERLARIKALLAASELGALLCFDMGNIRYITATHIGTWAADKLNRFCLLPQGDEPIMWDFGSAARHHGLYTPRLRDRRPPPPAITTPTPPGSATPARAQASRPCAARCRPSRAARRASRRRSAPSSS